MSEHFIKNIEIKNFKCFEDFKAEGFGRVNLIGGKNNVGKTAFMEAVYVNTIATNAKIYLTALSNINYMRDYINLNKEKINLKMKSYYNTNLDDKTIVINTNINKNTFCDRYESSIVSTEIYNINGKKEEFKHSDFKESPFKNLNINELHLLNNHFILSSSINDQYLNTLFNKIQLDTNEEKLNKYISDIFGEEFTRFLMIEKKPLLSYKEKWIPLSSLGEGIKRFITIICAIYSSKDGYLFIDEIENGIHYTNLDKLWEIILTISKDQNVQVFATTHSKECIESYSRVQKQLEDNESYYFEMIKNIKINKVFMRKLDSNQLEYELTHKSEFRG